MAYTLITSVGTGMYNKEKNKETGYSETDYFFNETQHFKTRLFMEALLKGKYRNIDQLIVIGTETSSWDALVKAEDEELTEKDAELWEELKEASTEKDGIKKGITESLRIELETYLERRFGIPVTIKVHTPLVDQDHVRELFECYSSIYPIIKENNDVLFDMTHGFRSMPMLFYQAMQYHFSDDTERKIELVYGEFGKKAYVRNLSEYWRYSQISAALHVFIKKLDGFTLAKLIESEWPKGADAIKALSDVVQANFALHLPDVIKKIRSALKHLPKGSPVWIEKIKAPLQEVKDLEDHRSLARTLYNYSAYLYGHDLKTQAVITLQNTVETAIAEKFGDADCIGDYMWWQNHGKTYLNKAVKRAKIYPELENLGHRRNNVAHGGAKDIAGKLPSVADIPKAYEEGKRVVAILLDKLEL